MQNLTLNQIEQAIEKAKPEDQRRLLARLPKILALSVDDTALLKLAEPSFEFWNNDKDSVYDRI